MSQASNNVVVEGRSQGILLVGWLALRQPAARFVVEVVPHVAAVWPPAGTPA
jgi:hypothetical protein